MRHHSGSLPHAAVLALAVALSVALTMGVPPTPHVPVATHAAQGRTVAPVAAPAARVTAERWIRPGREVDLTIASTALGRSEKARLLLPRGWSATSSRRWPVLYLLHGCCERGAYRAWTRRTDVERLAGRHGVIVVMPPAGWAGFYSNWSGHGRAGAPQWEDFHLTELRRIVERQYGGGSRRAIAGLSMGGFGALSYAARHPRMFVAAASFSGVVHTLMDVRGPALTSGLVLSGGSDPTALWGDPVRDADVWAAHNPYDLARRLRSTPVILSSGNGLPGPLDEGGEARPNLLEATIGAMNRHLLRRLRAVGVPVTARLYGPGTHTWPYWQRELRRAFPMLMRALGAQARPVTPARRVRDSAPIRFTDDPRESACVSATPC